MIVVLALLVLALIATIVAFVVLLDRRDKRSYDERSELLSRIQAPHVLNPRALNEPTEPPEPPERDYSHLAGRVSPVEIPVNGDG